MKEEGKILRRTGPGGKQGVKLWLYHWSGVESKDKEVCVSSKGVINFSGKLGAGSWEIFNTQCQDHFPKRV